MFELTFLDASAGLGLAATGVLTFNFLLGMLLSTAYKQNPYWKKLPLMLQQLSLKDLHNWTAYLALCLAILHPIVLFFDKEAGFGWQQLFFPLSSPKQAWIVLLGVIALYALLITVITSLDGVRKRMGFRFWKNLHLVSYATACLFLVHGLLMDPLLKDRPTDWIDAEKAFSEICMLVILVAGFFRYQYFKQHQKTA